MTHMRHILLGALLLFAAAYGGLAAPLPQQPPKATWKENGRWPLSVQGAIGRMRARMTGEGFRERHEIRLDNKGQRFLFLWEKGPRKVIYMLWSISVDSTGYSWGEYHDRQGK